MKITSTSYNKTDKTQSGPNNVELQSPKIRIVSKKIRTP